MFAIRPPIVRAVAVTQQPFSGFFNFDRVRLCTKNCRYPEIVQFFFQIGYLAVNRAGETGAYAIHKGFNYALFREGKFELIDSDHYIKA